MKMNVLRKDEKSVEKILQLWDDHNESEIEIETRSCWILSIIGALSIGGILLVSELVK